MIQEVNLEEELLVYNFRRHQELIHYGKYVITMLSQPATRGILANALVQEPNSLKAIEKAKQGIVAFMNDKYQKASKAEQAAYSLDVNLRKIVKDLEEALNEIQAYRILNFGELV